ncbi:hypothetical protein BpHYR1_038426 [Brachionus plicatilis]|uniref:Uncharacterized protein n=1 Tax=Brachionus plicatilis TaxID=10195 RepID=A0A3M7Q0L6_BRAPC|nr:hypothetical protein BpHYR1_038426 [Brachionus plicatilis]
MNSFSNFQEKCGFKALRFIDAANVQNSSKLKKKFIWHLEVDDQFKKSFQFKNGVTITFKFDLYNSDTFRECHRFWDLGLNKWKELNTKQYFFDMSANKKGLFLACGMRGILGRVDDVSERTLVRSEKRKVSIYGYAWFVVQN